MNENFRDKFYFSHLQKQEVKSNKGITLIALIITIIVLLILAGVSIAMLTGENGILKRANEAVDITKYKTAEEKVNLAIIGAMADDGQMTVAELKREVGYQSGSVTGDAFPVQVQMDGYTFTVDAEGNINNNGSGGENKPPVHQEALGTVTGNETTNTVVQDNLGNQVVVPPGFIVKNPNNNVTDGIIIQDVDTNRPTCGSEFVWIPVGTVTKADGSTTTIKLSRYTFDVNGKETDQGDKAIIVGDYDCQELATSYIGNTTAKDINTFKTSAERNNGYYIGRYEARTATKRTARGDALTQITEKPGEYVYNYVTQPQAAQLSRSMYGDSNFTSDLVNSYAWDTAITFLQEFDNREKSAKTTPYSQQISLNTNFAEKGTNQLVTKDVICNAYDMASNTDEWSTETFRTSYHDVNPCVVRGGGWNRGGNAPASDRTSSNTDVSASWSSFRPLLYL